MFAAFLLALFFSPALRQATFLGVPLAKRSLFLAVLCGIGYLIENTIMIRGLTEEERAVLPTSDYWLTPVSIFCSAFFMPSVLSIYWLTSSIFLVVQNTINYWIMRPYLRKQVHTKFVPRVVITEESIDQIIGLDKDN